MLKKRLAQVAAVTVVILAFAGCAPSTASVAPTRGVPAAPLSLAVSDSAFGPALVDGRGMSVYIFDTDIPDSGTSNCTAGCLSTWPPILETSGTPPTTGVTATIGSITVSDSSTQVTVNGSPLYYYAGDTGPGVTKGQGIEGTWWLVSPDGKRLTGIGSG